jgi:hypothetical protein
MSEEKVNETVETPTAETPAPEAVKVETVAEEPKVNPVAEFLALKESNANMFYGIIGGVGAIVVALLALGFGGSDAILKKADTQSIASGQKYTLKSPNAAAEDGEQTIIRLMATPGAITAFDDDENKSEECRKFPEGTHVIVLDKQEMSSVVYAKVQIDEEACNGTIGWVLAVNL